MQSFTYTIRAELGIHARPAGLLMKEARKFSSNITLHVNGKSADVKKLIALMSLAVRKGADVTVSAEGADEAEAAARLKEFFEATF